MISMERTNQNMKAVTTIVIGGGRRGKTYANFSLDFPNRLKIVGIAEPIKANREFFQRQHKISDEKVFTTWEDAAKPDKFADCVLVTTQDHMHKNPAVAFAKKGYHILLEKPMAPTYKDCKEIVAACKESGVIMSVCHVLRYTPLARKVKDLLDGGVIGDITNIQFLEPASFWHFTHSNVRGNWRKEELSSPILLFKSCHDIDLIQMWMGDKKCTAVSSFGSLKHFTRENKPKEAGSRCVNCAVEDQCPYSAKKIYMGRTEYPTDVITDVVDVENVTEALKSGPYGRCVYECDNDVMDNQVVSMQFEGGATVTLTLVAFTQSLCLRRARIFGTVGELSCDFETSSIKHFDFLSATTTKYEVSEEESSGGDFLVMDAFVEAVATNDSSKVLTGPEETLESHVLVFAAEKARKDKCVIDPSDETDL